MYSIASLQSLIARSIDGQVFPIKIPGIIDPLRYFLNIGGKRLRPALVLMAADLFGGDVATAMPAALAIEYYHNFTLIHDDMMDKASLRRGHATVHEKWDSNTAILAGDALLVLAYQSLANCPADVLPKVLATFNKSAMEVCEGQQFDLEFEKRKLVSEAEYVNMIRLKTAVLLGAALQLGAILGGASDEDAANCYKMGVNTGIAFQLQDDILDVYGDADKIGKQVGGDIVADKKTLLLIKALELADGKQQQVLNRWLQNTVMDAEEKIRAVTCVYDELGLKEMAIQRMRVYAQQAEDGLDNIGVPAERKDVLAAFFRQLFVREF